MSGKYKHKDVKPQEVWYARFPYEENPSITKVRPVMVLSKTEDELMVTDLEEDSFLSVKVTGHEVREDDDYDTIIIKWKQANLTKESVARISKTINLVRSQFLRKIGDADEEDFENIFTKYVEYLESTSIEQ